MTGRLAVAPAGVRPWLADAAVAGGASLVDPAEATGLIWAEPDDPTGLGAVLADGPAIEWVQLPWAGVEPYADVIRAHPERRWTCGKGVYAEPVAEMAMALLLAGFRGFGTYVPARSWAAPRGRNLLGARVVVAGGGGIAESFVRLLAPFGADVTVVRRRPGQPLPGASRVVGPDLLDAALEGADALVLALALTPETTGMVDRRRLDLLADDAWLINVARGRHVVTEHLVNALNDGSIGGAGLDVTDPEPLPDGHPLWAMEDVIITPHIGNTPEMALPLLFARITTNVRRWLAGEALLGPVDVELGY